MTKGESLSRAARGALWILIGVACAFQAYEIPYRGIDPDEFEHLHAAFCVWHGDVPYRDFFEHHAPALYYLVWPLFALFGPRLAVLWGARAVMFGCSLVTLGLAGRLAGRSGGKDGALVTATLLAWTTVFQAKGIELRPDVPAMLLLLMAVAPFTYATGGGSWRRFLYIGFFCGLATLFTQKSLVPAAGIMVASCFSRLLTRVPRTESPVTVLARVIIPIVAGVSAVWGVTSLLFATAGAAGDFWYSTWFQLWNWPIRSSRWDYLRPTLAGDLTVWGAAASQVIIVARRWRERETWENQRGAVAVIALGCIASLPFVKATYPQFYLLWMPFLAVLAGRWIVECNRRPATGTRLVLVMLFALLLCGSELFLGQRALLQNSGGSLPHLAVSAPLVIIGFLISEMIVALIAVSCLRKNWPGFMALIAGLGMAYGVLRDLDNVLWSNSSQIAAIEGLQRQIPAEGRVLDGFTGFAALRPHAWYYWWINKYSLALIPEVQRETGLLERLNQNPPAAVLLDENLALLPPRVVDWIRTHYEPVEPSPLWLLKQESRR